MNISRKLFMLTLPVLGAGLWALRNTPIKAFIGSKLSIGQIVAVSWKDALEALRNGNHWVSPALNAATKEGRIIIKPLREVLWVSLSNQNNLLHKKQYEVKELAVPVTWTTNEENKIAVASQLITNSIQATEDYIEEKLLPNHVLVVSKGYREKLGEIKEIPYTSAYCFTVYTCYAQIPLSDCEDYTNIIIYDGL